MLVLSRKKQESITIITTTGDRIRLTLTAVRGDSARIGIEADRNHLIFRDEVMEQPEVKARIEALESLRRTSNGEG